jgi:hypothetical protein
VLKCLDDALLDGGLHDFDMYFGISAGAVVLGLVSMGYSSAEVMASIVGHEGGRISSINLSMMRLGHLNLKDMRRRLGTAARRTAGQVATMLRGNVRRGVEDTLLEYTALVETPFHSDDFKKLLRGLLTASGATNEFAEAAPRTLLGRHRPGLTKARAL